MNGKPYSKTIGSPDVGVPGIVLGIGLVYLAFLSSPRGLVPYRTCQQQRQPCMAWQIISFYSASMAGWQHSTYPVLVSEA